MRVANRQARANVDPICALGTNPACPFLTFAASVGQPAGSYWFDVSGSPIELYAKGDGWILVASSRLDGTAGLSAVPAPSVVVPGINLIYDQATLTPIANQASDVRVSDENRGQEVVSTTTLPITRMRAYETLKPAVATYNADDWSGDTVVMTSTCVGNGGTLAENIYHACGNNDGLHWIPNVNFAKWIHSQAIAGQLNLWVK